MLTYHCKLCDKRFYQRLQGNKKRVYCSYRCHAKARIAGKDNHLRWISINDRVPKDFEMVLLYLSEKEQSSGFYRTEFNPPRWYTYEDTGEVYPTHWMPLPRPPKELRRPKLSRMSLDSL